MHFPSGNFVDAVRSSCRALVDKSPVNVSAEATRSFLLQLDKHQFEQLSLRGPLRPPLKFSTTADEINFVALVNLLNFGSGYRRPLYEMCGRGAFDTIQFGVMAFHISDTPVTAEHFKSISVAEVADLFQLPLFRDVTPPDKPYLTLSEPSELKPLAEKIANVLNTTGAYLVEHGYKDLATFILDVSRQERQPGQKPQAHILVEHLVRAFPAFQDSYHLDGIDVYLYKKAQILVYDLWVLLRDQDPELFDYEDIHDLTVFADNVLPTLLLHYGILEAPEAWKQDLETFVDMGEHRMTVLRAASVVACRDIVDLARPPNSVGAFPNMTEGDLDMYLWQLGKAKGFFELHRLELRDTVMF